MAIGRAVQAPPEVEIWVFGSVLRGETASDVDLIVTYEDGALDLARVVLDQLAATNALGLIDATLLSQSEVRSTDFVSKVNAERLIPE
jgi:predicted nucleotidyltransferase